MQDYAFQNKTSSIKEIGFELMDKVRELLLSGEVVQGMSLIAKGLNNIKSNHADDEWKIFSQADVLEHSLAQLIYQDPFTRHSFDKPRGYAGDAELLDYIYNFHPIPDDITSLGKEILKYTAGMSPMSLSINARRDTLAEAIDCIASETGHPPRILSVACGHLRESQKSEAIQSRRIGELIAFDQDPLSLQLIKNELSEYPIQTVQGSITALLRKSIVFKDLDLIYASGLYDYLSQPFAAKLTKILFEMLRPGGKLLIANLVPNHSDVGYMETFMQWRLIYRTESQLEDVAKEIPDPAIAHRRSFFEENGNIVFLELMKD